VPDFLFLLRSNSPDPTEAKVLRVQAGLRLIKLSMEPPIFLVRNRVADLKSAGLLSPFPAQSLCRLRL
jgi:hypothetical protein